MCIFYSKSESETAEIAARLAQKLRVGDIVALYGTLGVGKTAFCRGFIQSFLTGQEVLSPTFTLLQTYDIAKFPIYHFDMYRLKNQDEAYEIGIEDAFAEGISLIEWPEKIGTLLPQKHISVFIEIIPQGRKITIKGIDL